MPRERPLPALAGAGAAVQVATLPKITHGTRDRIFDLEVADGLAASEVVRLSVCRRDVDLSDDFWVGVGVGVWAVTWREEQISYGRELAHVGRIVEIGAVELQLVLLESLYNSSCLPDARALELQD